MLGLKIVFIGDAGAGKTAINHKFITGKFEEDTNKPTVGVIFSCRQYTSPDFKPSIKLQFWDTAGQERFRSIVPMYYRGSSAILLVFDLSNVKSFLNIKTYWINQIKDETALKIYLIGNKKDLTSKREVSHDEASLFAKENNLEYLEISAKCDNLEPVLANIISSIRNEIIKHDVTIDKLKFYGVNVDREHNNNAYKCCGLM